MKNFITYSTAAAILLIAFTASANSRTVYRDSSGKMTGSSQTVGSRTVYRDASGRITGRAQLPAGAKFPPAPNQK